MRLPFRAVAALKGHDVVLYEKEPVLGGLLNLASLPPSKYKIEEFRNYLINQLKEIE